MDESRHVVSLAIAQLSGVVAAARAGGQHSVPISAGDVLLLGFPQEQGQAVRSPCSALGCLTAQGSISAVF